MLCPQCGKELSENAKFCGYCGMLLTNSDLERAASDLNQPKQDNFEAQPVAPVFQQPQPMNTMQPPKKKKWKLWMTITVVAVAAVALSIGVWALVFSTISNHVGDFSAQGIYDFIDGMSDDDTDTDVPKQLMRTWTQSGDSYYGKYTLKLTFTQDTVSLVGETSAGTQSYGEYEYYMVDEDTFYVPDFDQEYKVEWNDNGNMLTVSPGLYSQADQEQWFNFDVQ